MADWTTPAVEAAGRPAVLWEALTWPQIEALQQAGPGLVLLPIGATEQHGPHLPTGTDNAIATALCHYASAKTSTPVLPTVSVGVSVGHTTRWPGTVSVRHETLILNVCEIVDWLLVKGWSRVLLINSHFGNDATLRVAVDRLRTDHLGKLQINVVNTFKLSPAIFDYFITDAEDLHANRAETDLMLYLAPHTVDHDRLGDSDDPDRTVGKVFSYPVAQTSTNGVTGSPSLATAQRGKALFREMGDALADLVERAKTEQPPLPFTPNP